MRRLACVLLLASYTSALADPSADAPVITPLEEGQSAPFSGVLFPEEAAEKAFVSVVDLKRCKSAYAADQQAWEAKEVAYKQGQVDYQSQLKKDQQGWFEQNKGLIGGVLGFVLGVGVTLLVVHEVKVAQR